MAAIVVLLGLSWILIRFLERTNLSVLGLKPTKERMELAMLLFLVTGICCSTGFFMEIYFGTAHYVLNPKFSATMAFNGLWQNIRSVLVEELLCRGVALYILIKRLGQKWGVLISAIVFGVMHWINVGAWGNLIQMAFLFTFTFFMGLLLAYAYAKTFSLYIPFAIHLGWNLVQNFVFPDGPFGTQIFIKALPQPQVTVSYFVFFAIYLLPKVTAIVAGYLIVRYVSKRKEMASKKLNDLSTAT